MCTSITLSNGVRIPQVGLGVFQVPAAETQRVVESALEAGYRHIDTAAAYNNEAGVGAAIRVSGLPRESIFITTKLRNGEQGYDATLRAYDESCRRLNIDQADLYLIHWPNPEADLYLDSWRALAKLHAEGAVRAVGVSNFLIEHLDRLQGETDLVPTINQIELHPTFQQRELTRTCRERSIAVEAYSPLGQGSDLDHPDIKAIAAGHGKSPAQVVLRWHLQLGHVVIPKSATPERIRLNRQLDDFGLTAEESDRVSAMDCGQRIGNDPRTFSLSQIR